MKGIPRLDWRRAAGLIASVLLIATGVYLYELWYWSDMTIHPIVYLSGCSLTLAGCLWLASDWFGL
jgi:hypothetical protein